MTTDRTGPMLPDPGALAALVDPERVTVAGDFHSEVKWGRRVLKEAARAGSQVVVEAGDFGVWPDRSGVAFLNMLDEQARTLQIPVVFAEGNHEDHDYLETFPIDPATGWRVVRPWVLHAPRGHRWTWRGLTWLALGGATSLNREDLTAGFDWFPQEELTTGDVYRAALGGTCDVMVTHDCPAGVPIPGLGGGGFSAEAIVKAEEHRVLLRQAVDIVRPTHLFHGHYHTRYSGQLHLEGGPEVHVEGLDMNGTMSRAYLHLDLDILAAESAAARA